MRFKLHVLHVSKTLCALHLSQSSHVQVIVELYIYISDYLDLPCMCATWLEITCSCTNM